MEGGKTQESSADEGAEEDGDCDEVEESTIISTSYLPASYRMRETRRYLLKEREENLPNSKMAAKSADEGAEGDGDCDEVGESTIISYLPASRMRETRRYLLKEREENLPNNSKMAAKSTISTSFRLVLQNRLHGFISDWATCRRAKSVTSSKQINKLQGSVMLIEEDESTVDRSFIPDALPKANTCYYP